VKLVLVSNYFNLQGTNPSTTDGFVVRDTQPGGARRSITYFGNNGVAPGTAFTIQGTLGTNKFALTTVS
jgi:hypothetical protein